MSVAEPKTEVFTVTGVDMEETQREGDQRTKSRRKPVTIFERYIQPCLAEHIGTTLFVFVGCASVIGNMRELGTIQPAVAHGLALGVLIMVFGEISGGHFNPAVSLSVYLCGGMELSLLGPYILAQLSGGMTGAALAMAVYPSDLFIASSGGAFNVVRSLDSAARATIAEMVMTLFLTTVVCMGAVNSRTRSLLVPLCIGVTVMACILAGGPVSGACMNPARAFGPAVTANYWDHHWIYWVGPTSGALLTVSFVRLLFGDRETRIILK